MFKYFKSAKLLYHAQTGPVQVLQAKSLGKVWKIQKCTTHNAHLIFYEIYNEI